MTEQPANFPASAIAEAFEKMDGVYSVIKDKNSVFLWVNQNFADLVGQDRETLIGATDDRAEHVAHDKAVMASGQPLLNFHETIDVPAKGGNIEHLQIVTQKGLLRGADGTAVTGITVCFSKQFPDPSVRATQLISKYGLNSIALGGLFAPGPTPKGAHSFSSERTTYSTNYFMLRAGEVLKLHSLKHDEQWFFHEGSSVKLHIFDPNGTYACTMLGPGSGPNEEMQVIVAGGCWFGAEVQGQGYSFVSCSLSPAYEAADSKMPSRDDLNELNEKFSEAISIIQMLTHG